MEVILHVKTLETFWASCLHHQKETVMLPFHISFPKSCKATIGVTSALRGHKQQLFSVRSKVISEL